MRMSPVWTAAALVLCAACAAPAADPPLEPKPYRIGIAPSHIATPTTPLFSERVDEWDEVRESIDFYKAYSLQAVPPKWATPLPVDSFAVFVKKHGIEVDAEFGSFGLNDGVDEDRFSAERAKTMHAWMGRRGIKMHALHLDGPVRRMLAYEGKKGCSLPLAKVGEEFAVFIAECRAAFPGTQIGLITNFPNSHYTAEHPGMLGGYTQKSGVHYLDALEAVWRAEERHETQFDFVEVDCPFKHKDEFLARSRRGNPVKTR